MSGIVKMLNTVPSNTEFAALSCPLPINSDKFNTTDAIGQLQRMTIAFSMVGSHGRKTVIAITASGISICFANTDIYGVIEVNIDESLTVASLIPRTNIHIGVLMVTNISTVPKTVVGSRKPKINIGIAKYEAIIAGFKNILLKDIYFGLLDIARHPRVKPIRFIDIENTDAYTIASGWSGKRALIRGIPKNPQFPHADAIVMILYFISSLFLRIANHAMPNMKRWIIIENKKNNPSLLITSRENSIL